MQHTNVSVVREYYVNIPASAIRHSDMPRSGMQQRERAKYCPTERELTTNKAETEQQ